MMAGWAFDAFCAIAAIALCIILVRMAKLDAQYSEALEAANRKRLDEVDDILRDMAKVRAEIGDMA